MSGLPAPSEGDGETEADGDEDGEFEIEALGELETEAEGEELTEELGDALGELDIDVEGELEGEEETLAEGDAETEAEGDEPPPGVSGVPAVAKVDGLFWLLYSVETQPELKDDPIFHLASSIIRLLHCFQEPSLIAASAGRLLE